MNDNIQQRIDYFTNNDKHTGYQDFLHLAAQPLLFSSDLLYKLWLNFKAYRNKNPKQQAKYFVVSDLILSSLCRPVGADLFCMEEDIRKYLLNQLQPKQKKAVAQFVAEYAKRNKSKLLANIYEVYSLWAKGILEPKEMEKAIKKKLQNKTIGDYQKVNYLSLYFNTLDAAEADKETAQQKLNISLAYAQSKDDENVLKVVLPWELRGKVQPNSDTIVEKLESIKEDTEFENSTPTESIHKYFRVVKKVQQLSPIDIMDLRARNFYDFYYPRPTSDQALKEALEEGENVLLMGNSLAGKTRAVYEALKKNAAFKDHLVLVPEFLPDFNAFPNWETWAVIANTKTLKLVFLDDINLFFQKANANEFIASIIRQGMQIVATCRTGPEYDFLSQEMTDRIQEQFEEIEIPKIEAKQRRQLLKEFDDAGLNIDQERFDGNVGALFLPLKAMKKRYSNLLRKKKQKEPTSEMAIAILEGLKALYYAANFEQKSTYSLEKLQDFCRRKLDNKKSHEGKQVYGNDAMYAAFQKEFNKEKKQNILTYWNDALEQLTSTPTKLNFIKLLGNNLVYINDMYFNKYVVARNYKEDWIVNDIQRLYPTVEARKAAGFFVRTYHFNKLIDKSRDFREAKAVLKKMKSVGVKPGVVSYTSVLNKAPDFESAKDYLDSLLEKKLSLDVVSYTSVLSKAPDFEIAKNYLDSLLSKDIALDVVSYNSVLNKAPDFQSAKDYLDSLLSKDIALDVVSYNSVLNKAPDFQSAKDYLDSLLEKKLPLDVVSYTSVLNKVPDFQSAKDYLDSLLEKKLSVNVVSYTSVLNKAPDFQSAKDYLDSLLEKKLSLDVVSYNSVLNKAPDFESAKDYLDSFLSKDIALDVVSYNSVLSKAPDFEIAKNYLDSLLSKDIASDVVSYTTVLSKAPDFESAMHWWKRMRSKHIWPNKVTFNILKRFTKYHYHFTLELVQIHMHLICTGWDEIKLHYTAALIKKYKNTQPEQVKTLGYKLLANMHKYNDKYHQVQKQLERL